MNNGKALAAEEPEPAVAGRGGGVLITLRGPSGSWRQHVVGPFVRIGSDPRCEVVLPSGPRVRLFIQATPCGLYCLGFAVRRATPVASGWLRDGQMLALDRSHQFSARSAAPNPNRNAVNPLPEQPAAVEPLELEITSLLDSFRTIRFRPRRRLTVISRQTLIWSSPDSRAAVVEPHCVLYWDDRQLWAIDLFGGAGLRVDGQPVDSTPVAAGHSVIVGSYCIRRPLPAGCNTATPPAQRGDGAQFRPLAGGRYPPGTLDYLHEPRFTAGDVLMPRKDDRSGLLTPAGADSSNKGANGSTKVKKTPDVTDGGANAGREGFAQDGNAGGQFKMPQHGAPIESEPIDEPWLFDRLLEQQTRSVFERRYRRMTVALAVGGSAVAIGTAALMHAVQHYDLAQWLRLTNG